MTSSDGATEAKGTGLYAEVNGVNLYFEIHGVGRLEARAVHERQPEACLGLGEGPMSHARGTSLISTTTERGARP